MVVRGPPRRVSNYLPHHTKKRQARAARERKLRRLIAAGAPTERLLKAATEVRDARVRELRARLAQVPPVDDGTGRRARLQALIRAAAEVEASAVLAEFES